MKRQWGSLGSVLRRSAGQRRRPGHSLRARASTVVEFAVVLPLLLTVLFGIMEYGWLFMVRQTLQNAAREGTRLAVLKTTTEPYANVLARINEIVQPLGITPTVEMTHATPNDPVEMVKVSVPVADVSLMGNFFGERDYDLTGVCSMRKEGMDDENAE